MAQKNNTDAINELIGIEAMSQLLLEKSRKLRLKLAEDSSPATSKKKKSGGLSQEELAGISARRRQHLIRSAEKARLKEASAKKL